jgi:hypothetical protein
MLLLAQAPRRGTRPPTPTPAVVSVGGWRRWAVAHTHRTQGLIRTEVVSSGSSRRRGKSQPSQYSTIS